MTRRRRGGRPPYAQMGQPPQSAAEARRQMEQAGEMVPFIRGRQLDLGDLSGSVVEPVIASFRYFGKTFRVNPDLTETMVVDLLEAGEDVSVDDPRQLIAAKAYVRDHIHPDDFDEFWDTAIDNRQGVQEIIKVCWKVLEQVTDRPTTPPSGSSDGRPDTATNSPAGASAPVIASTAVPTDLESVAQHFVDKFETRGRPDLAAQVMLSVEARQARELATA